MLKKKLQKTKKRRSKYSIGYKAENLLMNKFRKEGFFAIRSSGSKGPFDLIVIGGGKIRFIQVKSTKSSVNENNLLSFIKISEIRNFEKFLTLNNLLDVSLIELHVLQRPNKKNKLKKSEWIII